MVVTKKTRPTFDEEVALWECGYTAVAGVDEVGRGAFAGPVVAGAVILPRDFPYATELNDSKVLSKKSREQLSAIIRLYAISYAIAEVPLVEINRFGIGRAAQKAFSQAVGKLSVYPEYLLLDAFYLNRAHKVKQKAIIHGDGISVSIAAASIIAKVYRDRVMDMLDRLYPAYNFAENKGYGTDEHRAMIRQHGLCPIHRTSFDLAKFL